MRENESVVKFYSAQFLSLYLITKDQKEMGVKGFGRGTNKRSVCVHVCVAATFGQQFQAKDKLIENGLYAHIQNVEFLN